MEIENKWFKRGDKWELKGLDFKDCSYDIGLAAINLLRLLIYSVHNLKTGFLRKIFLNYNKLIKIVIICLYI